MTAQPSKKARPKQTAFGAAADVLCVMLGAGGLLYSYIQFDITLVDYKLVLGILVVTGIVFAVIFKRKNKYAPGFAALYGGMVLGFLFFLNNNFTAGAHIVLRPRIVDRSASAFNVNKPSVTVDMDTYTKTITIEENQDQFIQNALNIVLTVDKGLLGFDIIYKKRLTDD